MQLRLLSILIWSILLWVTLQQKTAAQMLRFNNLGIKDGLSSNRVNDIAVDQNGFLWIATSDGLNLYDGSTIETFYQAQHPDLGTNSFTNLFCDSKNRIWVGSEEGLCRVENRMVFQRARLGNSSTFRTYAVFETRGFGVVAFTSRGHYAFDETTHTWQHLPWLDGEILAGNDNIDITPIQNDQFLYTYGYSVRVVDFSKQTSQIVFEMEGRGIGWSGLMINSDEIIVGVSAGQLWKINVHTQQIVKRYPLVDPHRGELMTSPARQMKRGLDGNIYVVTIGQGLMVFNPKTEQITNLGTNALIPGSLISNRLFRLLCTPDGYVVVVHASGVSIANIRQYTAHYTSIFLDKKGGMFNGHINDIVETGTNKFWLAAEDRLIQWDRTRNESEFYFIRLTHYPSAAVGTPLKAQIRTVWQDRQRRLWVSAYAVGLGIYDPTNGRYTPFPQDSTVQAYNSLFLHDIVEGPDGRIWTCSGGGIFSIDPVTLTRSAHLDHPLLRQLDGKRTYCLFVDSQKRLWMGTETFGIYCYDAKRNTLDNYGRRQGLKTPCYSFTEDKRGTVYAATGNGLALIKDKKIRFLNRQHGLRVNQIQALLRDKQGNIWFDAERFMVRYRPDSQQLTYFDENEGFLANGFRVNAAYLTGDGRALFGGFGGINEFRPERMSVSQGKLYVNIRQTRVNDHPIVRSDTSALQLDYQQNNLTFELATIDLMGTQTMLSQYRLVGADPDWQMTTKANYVHYRSLAPGNYRFQLRASKDGRTWISAPHDIAVTIAPPFWQRPWFIGFSLLSIVAALVAWQRHRERSIQRKNDEQLLRQQLVADNLRYTLETEQVVNYFNTSLSRQRNVEEAVWDVARNCIAKLGFEHCVIYLLDTSRQVLVQKAAWGHKSTEDFKIISPLEIPIGKGIVGTVALTAQPLMVPDTTKDHRYIVDDRHRFSELAVPMVIDDQLIGVIDSEHSRKNFYTSWHLQILTTVASLCASKILVAQLEEIRQQTQLALVDNQRKAAEAKLQSMRLQMNPHFLFNALNSIQQMIMTGNERSATLYLSKFSKLLRMVLTHSDKQQVSLREEIKMLTLYVELESLRFDDTFYHEICCDEEIDQDETQLPPLLIQPFVENAIWHGLLHQEGFRSLRVCFEPDGESEGLLCTIEDNGIGRVAAQALNKQSVNLAAHTGKGMSVTAERLQTLNEQTTDAPPLTIVDLYDNDGKASGTRILIRLPN
ncbi:histidine kinase [Spirosoma sp. BT702]|uniref:Histidine kinase n=1 Tax=Spirosoma profusum TaxID=2771354 RepID=A0A927ASI0_9BACT|nr:two-component regulator propeller domain-containing protein [Spirosoma profusum]MBD2701310.1 histidine kinase [Spirosoma profusum]